MVPGERASSVARTYAATMPVPVPIPPMAAPQAASPTRAIRPVDQAGTSARLMESK